MRSIQLPVVALAASLLGASAAYAATYNFEAAGSNLDEITTSNFTISYAIDGVVGGGNGAISQTANGLGVTSDASILGGAIGVDSSDFSQSESLIVNFHTPHLLDSFRLGSVDSGFCFRFFGCFGGDDYELVLDSGSTINLDFQNPNPYIVNQVVSSFSVVARGDGTFRDFFGADDSFYLAEFTAINLEPVPLPASGGAMVLALLGLASMRRLPR